VELLAKDEWVAPSSVVLQDDGQNEDDIENEEEKENIVGNNFLLSFCVKRKMKSAVPSQCWALDLHIIYIPSHKTIVNMEIINLNCSPTVALNT